MATAMPARASRHGLQLMHPDCAALRNTAGEGFEATGGSESEEVIISAAGNSVLQGWCRRLDARLRLD